MTTAEPIDKIHDKMFFKIFRNSKNTRKFLSIALPEPILNRIILSKVKIDNTRYVSEKFDYLFSDIVVKTQMRAKQGKKVSETIDADIYILLEHKSYREPAILIQLLRYMLMVWEKDFAENKPPRVIIPLVFYHGKESWNMSQCFSDQFDVDDELKDFLLN
jgi:predicted transposase/invertase (TIGR01784 family)